VSTRATLPADDDDASAGSRRIEIVTGFGADRPQQEHTATIVLDTHSRLALAGIEVDYQRSYVQFALYMLIGVSGMLLGGLLFRR
jgi:hypothetical protein